MEHGPQANGPLCCQPGNASIEWKVMDDFFAESKGEQPGKRHYWAMRTTLIMPEKNGNDGIITSWVTIQFCPWCGMDLDELLCPDCRIDPIEDEECECCGKNKSEFYRETWQKYTVEEKLQPPCVGCTKDPGEIKEWWESCTKGFVTMYSALEHEPSHDQETPEKPILN